MALERCWIDGPLLSSYSFAGVIVGQTIRQERPGFKRTWSNFDMTKNDAGNTGPKLIADGYRSVEEARTAMEQYWAMKEPR